MLRVNKNSAILIFLLLCFSLVRAQVADVPVVTDSVNIHESLIDVGEIFITGNRKTKPIIILRELPFKTGDQYSLNVLVKKMETARKQLMNVGLFNAVIVSARKIEGSRIDISVEVKERWYIFPLPFFRPIDRNLNQWVVEQKASLDRVNYGAKLTYNNVTGRNDKLRFAVTNGYTKQLQASYDRPYIDKRLRWGIKFSIAAGKNREVNYNTIDDKQVFLKDDNRYVRNFINTNLEFNYRRAIKTRHTIGLVYAKEELGDTILALNPFYFKESKRSVRYPGIYYTVNYLNLDFNPYPTRGYAAQATIGKNGINHDFNIWQLHVKGLGVWPVVPKTFFSFMVYGGIKLPFKQPYYTQRFLGYGDVFLQGFEYNVVDGVAGGYVKASFTRELLNTRIRTPQLKKQKDEHHIPLRIYAKTYGNTGYVYSPQPGDNFLSNKMLYTGGIGIDIVIFYDVIFKFEWSFNSAGKNGIFFHQKSIF